MQTAYLPSFANFSVFFYVSLPLSSYQSIHFEFTSWLVFIHVTINNYVSNNVIMFDKSGICRRERRMALYEGYVCARIFLFPCMPIYFASKNKVLLHGVFNDTVKSNTAISSETMFIRNSPRHLITK